MEKINDWGKFWEEVKEFMEEIEREEKPMEYRETEEDICPICGAADLKSGILDHEGDEYFRIITCQYCGFIGKQWYELSYVSSSTVSGRRIDATVDYISEPCPYCGLEGGH